MPMTIPALGPALLAASLFLGCDLGPGPKERILSTDRTVDQANAEQLVAVMLQKAPRIRAEHAQLQQSTGKTLQLILRVESAPEPAYQGPDPAYHRDYYWLYAGFHGQDGIVKYYRYLVHKNRQDVLVYDDAKDTFVGV